MANWNDIDIEINQEISKSGPEGIDTVRKRKLKKLFEITNRPVILYAVELFNLQKINATQGDISIDLTDKDGFAEALDGITGNELDVIIHSPGGSPEATESLVKLLRKRFTSIRFIVPSIAKSAATMFAMSGNEIILGTNAELGPTDPQMIINGIANPAHAILRQFELAKIEISKNNSVLPAWLPILQQYGPSLLTKCKDAQSLTKELVTEWLAKHMLLGQKGAKQKASVISRYLADKKHLSHSRSIDIRELQRKGVKVNYANTLNPNLSEPIQDIYLAIMQTFMRTGAYKIYENHLGKGFYKVIQVVTISSPMQQAQPSPQTAL